MKVIIIGGVAGGMSAATRLRRLNEEAEIIVLEKGPFVSFANCGLPYYVSGEISDREDLLVQTPASLKSRFDLDVRPFSEAVAIDEQKKVVTIEHEGQCYTEDYDSLILSPGARPFIPPIPGVSEADNIFTLRNVPDLDKIMTYAETYQPQRATVIGAGFIGLEMAENLAKKGLDVTIVEKAPHVLPPLDEEMAAFVEAELIRNKVTILTGVAATVFENKGKTIVLDDNSQLETDLIILSVGVSPENQLAKSAGIELGLRGGILVDEHYETNIKDIYAVGDAIVVTQQITGEDALISLASPANRQGRQVADVISGLPRKNRGSIGTAIVRVFNLSAASTGLTERQADLAGLEYQVVHTKGKDHAGYYPGATPIVMKLIFNPRTGAIYGAQGVGAKGVDKRIDILATAIKGNLTVEDLPELEFTYAPPFGVAKDPVNMLGYVAMNVMEGQTEMVQWHELNTELAKGSVFLDVRGEGEVQAGKLKEGLHIPLPELRQRMTELSKDTSYIVSCESGLRSYIAERILKQHGYSVRNLDGAYSLYSVVRPQELLN
ncbi:FAD-dependent oxidoreductase [Vagococcus intermedius]|uniref:FAD-dependent oxidoreductase n=1 Tax=Vagococcus intermedius TaxID=2991418 RepID=A0AAF0I798_9ENTE|nr:FAD-dependent oxidoreductase [Vagococcus intermedius]WEG73200.1 FAD-dependent oxidoreductase [Vagococcus intermedius]WEG75285.1 FAD-dependent oxidoreductase [Vagococcus intermedius]